MIEGAVLLDIGKRSRNGRHVVKICDNMVRYMHAMDSKLLTMQIAKEVFDILGLDNLGLTKRDKLLLGYLAKSQCGLDTLEAYLNLPKQDIRDKVEPWLLKNNLMVRQSSGRAITKNGLDAIGGNNV